MRAVGAILVRSWSAAALGCTEHAADASREVRGRLVVNPHVENICVWRCLTPELSRAVLRPRRRDNVPCGAVAAKRSRLERFVRQLTSELLVWLTSGRQRIDQAKHEIRMAFASCWRRNCPQAECSRSRLRGACGRRESRSARTVGRQSSRSKYLRLALPNA